MSVDLDKEPVLSSAYDLGADHRPRRSYFICSTPRSGSSLVGLALADMPGAAVPTEYFNAALRERLSREWSCGEQLFDYVRAIHARRTTADGLLGVKLHWHQLIALRTEVLGDDQAGNDPYDVRASFLAPLLPDCRYLLITRRDLAAQAVSLFIAMASGDWSLRATDEAHAVATPQPPYDFDVIDRCRRLIEWEEACWRRFFERNDISPFVVVYERLVAAYDETLRSIAGFVGLDPAAVDVPPPPLRKQRTAGTRAYVEAYRDECAQRGVNEEILAYAPPDQAPFAR